MLLSLNNASSPLIVNIHVLENTEGVREHGKCESARKSVVYICFILWVLSIMTKC